MYRVEKNRDNKYEVKTGNKTVKVFNQYDEALLYCGKLNSGKININSSTNKKTSSSSSKKKSSNNKKISKKKKKKSSGFGLVIVIVIIIGILGYLYFTGNLDTIISKFNGGSINTTTSQNDNSINNDGSINENIIFDDFQIHFMMLGNDKAGDSIYIKAGDTDIIIDAGSRQSSATTLKSYMNNYITDGKLEYVILTHGDQDHVAGFTGTNSILSSYEIGTIIDNELTNKTTQIYNKYITLRNNLVSNGTTHWYAADCFNNKNGAKRDIKLSENVTMSILYNYYYFNKSSDENNYSVSTMFTYSYNGTNKYFMFTGDLEFEGEEKMSSYYDGSTSDKTLPEVELFKAGHHGSKTSSNECLLSLIKPKMCVVSCCCGTDEYTENLDNQFPTQQFITRISKYTDAVYITSTYKTLENTGKEINTSGYQAMNGNIIVSCKDNSLGLGASNNLIKLKDSEWFNQEITINGITRKMRVWG